MDNKMQNRQSGYAEHMSYPFLENMRKLNPTWRLMASTNAPLVISFLHREFITDNRRNILESELAARLDIFIYMLQQGNTDYSFPRTGKEYLDEWADDNHGWLRKIYPPGRDDPHYDLTPQAEKAIEWLLSLKPQAFIGTESRLITVFDLLRQILAGSELDPILRIAELERQKANIQQEIIRAERGEITLLSDTQVKERFIQAMNTAWEILADFRAVEQNFRALDRGLRERIATWDKGKGALLETIFDERDDISLSEQGKSFSAFWHFLMSSSSQEAFSDSLSRVLQLKPVRDMDANLRNRNIHHDWIDAGSQVQETVAALSQQLRRYVDETFLEDERRINQILREIEGKAIAIRNAAPHEWNQFIDGVNPQINLSMDRPMFYPQDKPAIADDGIEAGDENISAEALYSQIYVDKEKLKYNIDCLLMTYDQISLSQVVDLFPLEQGLSELLVYLVIASDNDTAMFYGGESDTVTWIDDDGKHKVAMIPRVVFMRSKLKDNKRQ
jgi:ribosomal protein S16